jgi:GMP reductase
MHIESQMKLDYSDVLIRPKRSALGSRADADIERTFRFVNSKTEWTGFPLIAANMDVTGTMGMARALSSCRAMVALHKYYARDALEEFFRTQSSNVFYTMGMGTHDYEKFKHVRDRVPLTKLNLDVANGYSQAFVDFVGRVREENREALIMAGAIATAEMAETLILAGADIVRAGIGSGSVCTTRRMTGVGYPQLSAVIECADAAHGLKGHVCADGGCTVPGDIAKAFGAGADFVMLGGMLAGHDECEGEITYEEQEGQRVAKTMKFYGMSSSTAMERHAGGVAEYRTSEGKTVEVPYRGPVDKTMKEITGGLRSMMTYIGATKLKEVPKRTTFVRVGKQLNNVFDE